MDNNLPNDPSNPNSGNNNPPPPFGSGFTPRVNPPDPNNPYALPPQQPVPQPLNSPTSPNPTLSSVASEMEAIPSDIPKPESNFKKAIKFIVKIKWARVSAYIVGFVGVVSFIFSLLPLKTGLRKAFLTPLLYLVG